MKIDKQLFYLSLFVLILTRYTAFSQVSMVPIRHQITLKEAHQGSLSIDTMLLNSYQVMPSNINKFYLDARRVFARDQDNFTDRKVIKSAQQNDIKLMGGPMLGDLKEHGVSIWFRPSNILAVQIKVRSKNGNQETNYSLQPIAAGADHRIVIDDLQPSTQYHYFMSVQGLQIAKGSFKTTAKNRGNEEVRLAFGSGFHKIGLHNPNLIHAILERKPMAMMLLGDIASDGRKNNLGLLQSDYLLRDLSEPWQKLSANVPLYAIWDDHDYFGNDSGGVPKNFTKDDRAHLRKLWKQNWNNPPNTVNGLYFNTRIGSIELIMLDTRSYRTNENQGDYGSYLGKAQQKWLSDVLKKSTATFKIISSGTMWSDYVTNGKDSWGVWDIKGREEILQCIETNKIPGVLLISGDRHGARGFTIPRTSGYQFYEFEPGSLGGVPGPPAIAEDASHQLFGYKGSGLFAFGEFTFNLDGVKSQVTFRLINELGEIMEENELSLNQLTPKQ
ncbi:alkaline phosphatase D family protein [Tamlana agarivorans]|uniref:Alkaline phosphatase D family protein n=1 Tax=Pseudotamlana agarivorans TaxID=481183 RepID=A0ACC5U9F9_9FLAO|nr:alkaline phosphatase D family protein [Tamlana agarivorans]MBU2950946.1 alkaline phosphatase D family protein [Tamlana agarivorans]